MIYLGSIYGFQSEISDRTRQENYEALSNSHIVSSFYACHGPHPPPCSRFIHTFLRLVRTGGRNANTAQPPTDCLEVSNPGWSAFQHEPVKPCYRAALAKHDSLFQSFATNLQPGQHELSSLLDSVTIH